MFIECERGKIMRVFAIILALSHLPGESGKYVLDCKQFNDEYVDVSWENCTLRKWLNNDFYSTAFSKSEQSSILLTALKNENNIKYKSISGGNDTKDKVFLLSLSDMLNPDYGFSEDTDVFDVNRRCAPTAYAQAQGAKAEDGDFNNTIFDERPCNWQLRSPGIMVILLMRMEFRNVKRSLTEEPMTLSGMNDGKIL